MLKPFRSVAVSTATIDIHPIDNEYPHNAIRLENPRLRPDCDSGEESASQIDDQNIRLKLKAGVKYQE